MVSNTMEDIEINVDDSVDLNSNKRRKVDNGSLSDKEDSELQVVDEDIDVSGPDPAPTFIEEVMDEGGGDPPPPPPPPPLTTPLTVHDTSIPSSQPPSGPHPSVSLATSSPPKLPSEPTISTTTMSSPISSTASVSPVSNKESANNQTSTSTSSFTSPSVIRSTSVPPNVTAIPLMMQSISSVGTTPSSVIQQHSSNMMSPSSLSNQHSSLSNQQISNLISGAPPLGPPHPPIPSPLPSPSLHSLPSPTHVSNMNDPSAVVRNLMSGVSTAGNINSSLATTMSNSMANNVANNVANNFQTSQNSATLPGGGGAGAGNTPPGAGNVPNPVGMTAHALLETLLAQVIAHTMNGNAPNAAGAAASIPPSTPTTPTPSLPFSSNSIGSDGSGQRNESLPPPPPPLISSVSNSLQDATKPLKETLDKINMLEQTTVSLDKQSAGIQRMVTEVVKKQEENTSAAGTICPRCKHMVGGGEQFISHLIASHNFIEQKGPIEKADFGSQAGLGTCRGWRYIRTKNSGTQSTLSMFNKGENKPVIDLTNNNSNNSTPPPDQVKSGAVPAPSPNTPNPAELPSPSTAPPGVAPLPPPNPPPAASPRHNLSPSPRGSVGYDSARATAANILSFVFSNPDINKQFTDYADIPKEQQQHPGPPIRSPKKQQPKNQNKKTMPANYNHLPFLQTINKQLQQHNGLALFDKWKEVKPVSPIIVSAQQEFMAHAFKQQQQLQAQQQAQQLQQQQLQQHQMQQAAHKRAVMQASAPLMHPATSIMQSSMQAIQPIQPTPIQASSLQQIRPHGSNFPIAPPMISVGELKDQYQQMISAHGGAKIGAFDESSDSPLKDCLPKVRASLVNGDIQLMWNIIGDERKCTGYRLFAYMGATAPPISSTWTEVGTVKALPMPMAVTLSQFSKGCSYHFTVRAIDSAGNVGPFSEPCSIKLSL